MNVINVHDAKTNFSKLLARVSDGEQIILGRSGRPVARLTPFSTGKAVHRQFKGGNLRLQAHSAHKLTPEYLHKLAASKYDD